MHCAAQTHRLGWPGRRGRLRCPPCTSATACLCGPAPCSSGPSGSTSTGEMYFVYTVRAWRCARWTATAAQQLCTTSASRCRCALQVHHGHAGQGSPRAEVGPLGAVLVHQGSTADVRRACGAMRRLRSLACVLLSSRGTLAWLLSKQATRMPCDKREGWDLGI